MATGGILFNGSSQYLEYAGKVVSGFPCSMVIFQSQTFSGNTDMAFVQQQSTADRYIALYDDSSMQNKFAAVRNPGNNGIATKSTTPDPSSSIFQVMAGVFTNTASRVAYYGSATASAADTTSMTDDLSSHDRVTMAAWHVNSGAAGLFHLGALAEAHFYNVALSSTDITALLNEQASAGSGTLPENLTGWVDGWKLSSNTDLTSIGGTRTLTAVGSPTTASLTLPYVRSGGGGGKLFRANPGGNLSGLGSGGPFFQNPLQRVAGAWKRMNGIFVPTNFQREALA